jgi:regulator of RNase E activity RraB
MAVSSLLTSNQENTNILSNCLDDASNPMSLLEILQEHHDEYDGLSKEEKAELVREYTEEKERTKKIRRRTARGRLQDVLNIVRNMQQLVS